MIRRLVPMVCLAAACSADRPAATPLATLRTTPPPTAAPATPPPAVRAFASTIAPVPADLRRSMTGVSWRTGCPVGLQDLRFVTLSHWTRDGSVRSGELIVHADAADAMRRVFRQLFANRYPITKMRLVDEYGGDDVKSMTDDNTSAFNCRVVAGTSRLSQHAYGRAVDVNPFENPWVSKGRVDPPAARVFTDRSRREPEIIRHGDPTWRAFADVGWKWGGDWTDPKDYQHFSASGR